MAPYLIKIFEYGGFEANVTIRFLFLVSFMASAIGVYLFARELTRRQITPILPSILYLIPPVPIFIFSFYKSDLYVSEIESAKSFLTIIYGDGAHFLALAILPFAAIFFIRFLRLGLNSDLVIAVVLCALILLANSFQALILIIILTVLTITELFIDQNRSKIKRYLKVVFLSLTLVAYWYTPEFWVNSFKDFLQFFVQNLKSIFPLPLIIGIIGLLFSFVFFARKLERQSIFISFLLFFIFLSLAVSWLIGEKAFIPHPHRLLPLVNMFGSLVVALTFTAVLDKLQIVERLKLESYPVWAKAIWAVLFGAISFIGFTLIMNILSPIIIELVSGENGLWTKVRLTVAAERMGVIGRAGGNFQLTDTRGPMWQHLLGYLISLLTIVVLINLLFRHKNHIAK